MCCRRKFGAFVFYLNLLIYLAYLVSLNYFIIDLSGGPVNNSFSHSFDPEISLFQPYVPAQTTLSARKVQSISTSKEVVTNSSNSFEPTPFPVNKFFN